MENNWLEDSLENLENDIWVQLNTNEGSHLIKTCNALRKKKLKDFTIEDLRIMIGQGIGLYFLMPIVINVLRNNLFAEGDMYKGDLLKNVLQVDPKFWNSNKNYWQEIYNLIKGKRQEILEMNFDVFKFEAGA